MTGVAGVGMPARPSRSAVPCKVRVTRRFPCGSRRSPRASDWIWLRWIRGIPEQASHRDLYWGSLEGRGGEYALLELTSFRRGKRTDRVLARCSAHGDWLEWLDGEPTTGGAN